MDPHRRDPHVFFNWGISSYFGWGVYGLNLLLAWAAREDLKAATLAGLVGSDIDVDPLELTRIAPALERSVRARHALRERQGQERAVRVAQMVLQPLHNSLSQVPTADGLLVQGEPDVGVAFLEDPRFDEEGLSRVRDMPLILAGSSWNQALLRESGAPRVELLLQGVDTSHFHPAPRRELFPGRFVVFSGGKLESRKGQDLVVKAFRIFAERHPEALLLTTWNSPWPQLAVGVGAQSGLLPLTLAENGSLDAQGWTVRNGIPADKTVHCGAVPNRSMARIVREADVAIFPNRAEGGTNLVAMETIACGVPTILSANTGHLDLLEDGTAYALRKQSSLAGEECAGWGESDVEEAVEALECVYQTRDRERALRGAEGMMQLSWARQMHRLGDLLVPLLPGLA